MNIKKNWTVAIFLFWYVLLIRFYMQTYAKLHLLKKSINRTNFGGSQRHWKFPRMWLFVTKLTSVFNIFNWNLILELKLPDKYPQSIYEFVNKIWKKTIDVWRFLIASYTAACYRDAWVTTILVSLYFYSFEKLVAFIHNSLIATKLLPFLVQLKIRVEKSYWKYSEKTLQLFN